MLKNKTLYKCISFRNVVMQIALYNVLHSGGHGSQLHMRSVGMGSGMINPKDFVSKAMDSLSKSPIDKGWAGLPDATQSYNGLSKLVESSPEERANKVREFVSEGKQMNAS